MVSRYGRAYDAPPGYYAVKSVRTTLETPTEVWLGPFDSREGAEKWMEDYPLDMQSAMFEPHGSTVEYRVAHWEPRTKAACKHFNPTTPTER